MGETALAPPNRSRPALYMVWDPRALGTVTTVAPPFEIVTVANESVAAELGRQAAPDFHVSMRKQYYFRPSPEGLLAWNVDRVVRLSRELPVRAVPLAEIRELDLDVFGADEPPTWRSFAAHVHLVQAAELTYPIIRAADGSLMDGRHRATKALAGGRETIDAVQFAADPAPDYVGRSPDELPYDDEVPGHRP